MFFFAPTPPQSPVLDGISWQTYQTLLRELEQAGRHLRVTYDRGRMVVMSPLPIHEKWKGLMGQMVEALAEHRDVLISSYGSTTWQREDLLRGLEADECYYVQHANTMRGKKEIDLSIDPPPDLAIEIDVTHHPLNRPSIYAALSVPEIWHYNGRRVECRIRKGEQYSISKTSDAFPEFEPSALEQFLAMHPEFLDGEIIRAFRQWLKTST